MKPSRELPKDRLATTDESGARVHLYPAEVSGRHQRRRLGVQWLLIGIFLSLPWWRLNGRQAFLIDLGERKFHLFGLVLWAHDTPLLLLALLSFIAIIAGITVLWGRAWCGWACPQTVFIERWFRAIERKIEGDHVARKRLDEGPHDATWLQKKTFKWTLFVLSAAVIAHSVLALFVGAENVLRFMGTSPLEHPGPFLFAALVTGILLFDFGWFREQFCIIACPYGRMQSALMDSGSLAIVYDAKRGEPRGKATAAGQPPGDCVDCFRCVQACPTGVDIRRGVQLECIACTACADACDDVMTRLGKPAGLIRYGRESEFTETKKSSTKNKKLLLWATTLTITTAASLSLLSQRVPIRNSLLRTHGTPYTRETDATTGTAWITNTYQWVIENQSDRPARVRVQEDSPQNVRMQIQAPQADLWIAPGDRVTRPLWIRMEEGLLAGQRSLDLDLHLELEFESSPRRTAKLRAKFVGPMLNLDP